MEGRRRGASGCIALVMALFFGLMIASAGTAVYPPVAHPGAALLCGGEVRYQSYGASYRPGEYTVTREIHCVTSKESEEITFRAVGLAFLIYSAALFVLLRFLAAPLIRGWIGQTLAIAPAPPAGLNRFFGGASGESPPGDEVATRLARLGALRGQGLITEADYEAKKAEILSRL